MARGLVPSTRDFHPRLYFLGWFQRTRWGDRIPPPPPPTSHIHSVYRNLTVTHCQKTAHRTVSNRMHKPAYVEEFYKTPRKNSAIPFPATIWLGELESTQACKRPSLKRQVLNGKQSRSLLPFCSQIILILFSQVTLILFIPALVTLLIHKHQLSIYRIQALL